MTLDLVTPDRRLTAAERREQILQAAAEEFGRHGYSGTTTDRIARAAGISQPYVVRMFGSKETLFVEVLRRSCLALLEAFRAVVAAVPAGTARMAALGDAYTDLIKDRGIHLPLMQGFLQGGEPVVGATAREGFLDIWRFLIAEAGMSEEEARAFLAEGMLINVLLGLRMPAAAQSDQEAAALLHATCGPKFDFVLEYGD